MTWRNSEIKQAAQRLREFLKDNKLKSTAMDMRRSNLIPGFERADEVGAIQAAINIIQADLVKIRDLERKVKDLETSMPRATSELRAYLAQTRPLMLGSSPSDPVWVALQALVLNDKEPKNVDLREKAIELALAVNGDPSTLNWGETQSTRLVKDANRFELYLRGEIS